MSVEEKGEEGDLALADRQSLLDVLEGVGFTTLTT
jgi:hypothetical protein